MSKLQPSHVNVRRHHFTETFIFAARENSAQPCHTCDRPSCAVHVLPSSGWLWNPSILKHVGWTPTSSSYLPSRIPSHAAFIPFRAVVVEKAAGDIENPRSPVCQPSEAQVEPPDKQKRVETSQPASASSSGLGGADAEHEDLAVPLFNVAMDLVTRCMWKGQVGCARPCRIKVASIT